MKSKIAFFTEEEFKELIGPGKDKINPATVIKSLRYAEGTPLKSEMLVRAIEMAVNKCSEEYIGICWHNLKEEMNDWNVTIQDGLHDESW